MDHDTHTEGDEGQALAAARAEYKTVTGKNPPPRMGLDKLLAKIEEAKAAPVADPPPEVKSVRVLLLCDHVFLPEDPTAHDWREGATRQYDGKTEGRRTRVTCHPELAAFLQERGQAEALDD